VSYNPAPEVLTKDGIYTEKADIYSYAIVLWEVAAKAIPFSERGNFGAVVEDAVLNGERPIMPTTIDPAFKKLMVQCWAQNPKDRPSFEEIIESLVEQKSAAEKKEGHKSTTKPVRQSKECH
jgi:hypothetical protein